MKNTILQPGSIINLDYRDFQGNLSHGLFLVLYDEELDSSNIFKDNFVALKISSQFSSCSSYCVHIDKKGSILKKPSIVICSKVQTFNKSQVYDVLGTLNEHDYKQVYKCYKKFITELERQMEDYI